MAAVVLGSVAFAAGKDVGSTPFFSAQGTAFDPQVNFIDSGAVLSAHVNVSADRKYVTIGSHASNQQLLALTPFTAVGGPTAGGFVGIPAPAPAKAVAGAKPTPPTPATPPSVLERTGMTLIAPLP